MPVSSYQAQQVLAELRKRLGQEGRLIPPDPSAVRVSTITIIDDEPPVDPHAVAPPVVAEPPVDATVYAPAVEQELERRAGSFMHPPLAPRGSAKPIPKTAPRPTPPRPKRTLGEGD